MNPELRRLGHRWLDMVIAFTAVALSLISLRVALDNANTQEKMLAATSRPILFYITGNRSEEDKAEINLYIRNDGAGPAFLKHLDVRYRGRPVRGGHDLLRQCCLAPDQAAESDLGWLALGTQRAGQSLRPAGDTGLILTMPETEANKEVWARLNRARFQLKLDACYCSVLGDCWRSDLSGLEPRPVDSCPTSGGYVE